MDYKLLIIRLVIAITFFVLSLKINEKIKISSVVVRKFKISSKIKVFTLLALVYVLLSLSMAIVEQYLNISTYIRGIIYSALTGLILGIIFEINSEVNINDKTWLG